VEQFEYLSVLVSIVIGLAITQLLSGAARLIQLRDRVRPHATTLCWMATLFVIDTQIWWAAFERRETAHWNFFAFLMFLAMPVLAFLASYLVLPELGDEDRPDLAASFDRNRPWFFGCLGAVAVASLAEEAMREGGLPSGGDAMFRVAMALLSLVAARVASPRFQAINAFAVLAAVVAYIGVLFLQLR
jgi:hypothetical protein